MAALTRKTWATENPSTARTAASVGPRTRLPLMAAEFRLIAPGRSARSTSNGMLAWKAGALSALAMPVNATAPYSAHSGLFVATSAASATVTTICTTCMTIR